MDGIPDARNMIVGRDSGCEKDDCLERTKRRNDIDMVTISDDDFMNDMQPKRIKLKEKKVGRPLKENAIKNAANMRELYASYPMLSLRCSPSGIFNFLKDLNERQRDDVKDLGFGNILDLTIKELPSRLVHWVVDNFDVQSCELKLQNGRRIEITDKDVHMVLGFPVGGRRILPIDDEDKENEQKLSGINEEWEGRFSEIVCKGKILQKHVVQLMKTKDEGGVWFKRHFIVLLASCLMETTTHGYVSPNFMHCLEDVTTVNQWNWSEFVISCLVRSKIAWDTDKSQKFHGPALFLLVLYVDKVKVLNKTVPRKFPSFINWDYARLKERQDEEIRTGGFGGGILLSPIVVNVDAGSDKCINGPKIVCRNSSRMEEHLELDTLDELTYCKNIIAKSNVIGKEMVSLITMIENAPPSVIHTDNFEKSVLTARTIIGNNLIALDTHEETEPSSRVTQRYDDEIWKNADVLKSLYEVKAAQVKIREFLKQSDDLPSLSMGLTQFFNREKSVLNGDQVNTDVAHIQKIDLCTKTPLKDVDAEFNVDRVTIPSECEQQNDMPSFSMGLTQIFNRKNSDLNGDQVNSDVAHIQKSDLCTRTPVKEVDADFNVDRGAIHSECAQQDVSCKNVGSVGIMVEEQEKHVLEPRSQEDEDGEVVMNDKNKEVNIPNKKGKVILGEPSTQSMTCRSKRVLRMPKIRCSPFLIRAARATTKLTKMETQLGSYVFLKDSSDEKEMLVKTNYVEIKQQEMMTLFKGSFVNFNVVDGWSAYLNFMEDRRSLLSPCRFFAACNLCTRNIIDAPKGWSIETRRDVFAKHIRSLLNRNKGTPLGSIHLFFFPIFKAKLFYVVCIDVRNGNTFVIDSLNDNTDECQLEKYRPITTKLKDYFANFLVRENQQARASLIESGDVKIVYVRWGDKKNKVDTGVYLMRHMETFMGDLSKWKSCTNLSLRSVLNALRTRYCATMITWEQNTVRDKIDGMSQYYFDIVFKKDISNIQKKLVA